VPEYSHDSRPYESIDNASVTGLTEAQKKKYALKALGAVEIVVNEHQNLSTGVARENFC